MVRRTPRNSPLVWLAVAPLIFLALLAVGGRAVALTTGTQPFTDVYALLPAEALEDGRIVDRWFASHPVLTWIHILSGGLLLTLAPFQFIPGLRRRHLVLHRWTGRVALLAAVPTVLSGFALQARSPFGGLLAASAIAVAGVVLLHALFRAYRAIRRRDTMRHREWMIRLLAVGLGVGMVRLIAIPLVLLTGRRPLELVGVAFWLGFALPIVAGELWIRATRISAARFDP